MSQGLRVVLLGGTSHVGKSTFARALARQMGWVCLSTDTFARHPGRPSRYHGEVPERVATYYLSREPEVLLEEVVAHYRHTVWPIAQAVVRARIANPYDPCLVLEGSAILPDCILAARFDRVGSAWLTAPPDLIANRIRENSRYEERTPAERTRIDAFLRRSLAFDAHVMDVVRRTHQRCVDVAVPGALDQLSRELLGAVERVPRPRD